MIASRSVMHEAATLNLMRRIAGEVPEPDRHRFAEIFALFASRPEIICPLGLPEFGRTMHRARIDLREILCHCSECHPGDEIVIELLGRFPEDQSPFE